jgi:glycosyltransferase involved in cell wall biosynthesis
MTAERRRQSPIAAVIPAHGEVRTIAAVVGGARRHVDCVIVVDDASRDGTAAEARGAGAAVLSLPARSGKGTALRLGLAAAFARGHAAAVTLDGDGQHLAAEIPGLIDAYRDGAELVLGDRTEQLRRMPLARRLTNVLLTAALRPWTGPAVRDSQCGFRLIDAALFARLRLETCCFEIESEVLVEAARAGAILSCVPVSAVYAGETSKIRPVTDALRLARFLARAAWRSTTEAIGCRLAPAARRLRPAGALQLPGCTARDHR